MGLAIDEGTLYPLLRRLESQGLLVSEWREEDKRNKLPRKAQDDILRELSENIRCQMEEKEADLNRP